MKTTKYTEKQLAKLIEPAFKNSPEPAFWGSSNGTFLNSRQLAKLEDKDKADYIEFKNPKLAAPSAEEVEAAKATAKAEKEAAAATAKAEKEAAAAKAKAEKEAAKAEKTK
jgi:hypothetical protein